MDISNMAISLLTVATATITLTALIMALPVILKRVLKGEVLTFTLVGVNALLVAYVMIFYIILPLSNWLPRLVL